MPAIAATLAGVSLNIGPEGISWELARGVDPVQRVFFLTDTRAARLMEYAKRQFPGGKSQLPATGPVTLEIKAPGYDPLCVRGLYILQATPGDDNRTGVVVVDRRWLWGRIHVARVYNERRRTGDKRLVGTEMQPIQTQETLADYGYKRATLRGEVPWTASEILEDLLTLVVGSGQYTIGDLPLKVTIENLYLDDSGTSALRRVLAYVPGAEIYVDLDGKIIVYNRLDLSETEAVEKLASKVDGNGTYHGLFGGGTVIKVDRSVVRPCSVDSLFEEECELRFDYEEGAPLTTRKKGREPRELQQVLPVVDPEVTVDDKRVSRGTYLPSTDWFDAIEALDDAPATAAPYGPLSEALVRQHWISGLRLLYAGFVVPDMPNPSPLWSLRLSTLQNHWRWTYRILPQWLDKIRSIRPYRVAILDQETGTRGRAEAYFGYMLKPTQRSLCALNEGEVADAGWNVEGYADDLTDARPGPATIAVLDEDNGLLHVKPAVDPFGLAAAIAPGTLDDFPSVAIGRKFTLWESPDIKLSATFRVAIVVTVTRAAPNDSSRYWRVEVDPQRAIELLPGQTRVGECLSPRWELKVGRAIQTARFAWVDARSSEIEEAWFEGQDYPSGLLVNESHLTAIAEANAARVYSYLIDRLEGGLVSSLAPAVKPTGALSSVIHYVTPQGGAFTRVSLPPVTVPPDLFALLPESTRQLVQRLVVQ